MRLTDAAKKMLDGEQGAAKRLAMDSLVKFGDAYDAEEMVSIGYAHVAAGQPLYAGDMEQLEALSELGATVVVPTSVNIANADMSRGRLMHAPDKLVDLQRRSEPVHRRMGSDACYTCTPYWAGHWPTWNTHMVSLESTVTIFCNSVLGAKSNRDGYFAIYAAMTGFYPKMGYHLDENRRGTHLFKIEADLQNASDFGCLGYHIGLRARSGVPVIEGFARRPTLDELDAMGAAIATSGGSAMFIVPGVTPPYADVSDAFAGTSPEAIAVTSSDIAAVYAAFAPADDTRPSIVHLGCPHASMQEMREYAALLDGKRIHADVELWITTSRVVRQMAQEAGLSEVLERAGAKVLSDTCPIMCHLSRIMAPDPKHGLPAPAATRCIVVDSAKQAKYVRDTVHCDTFLTGTAEAVRSAIEGRLVARSGGVA
ncbi:aconitase X catalytic domain-containing protein [Chitinasiproducens palmae]|uniref:Predicted aconitase subunit 1 n=1 Tax=Chitinasiproducens palmae TaxID=1770053 RepID=A0A1H2PU76_9BURK|nr:aconitase X catalytic domain-containing protein [Chitinasiproducens palmae]SDV50726.1 predicted aconitase subunit 1 [Chitinasiproducens palmae]